MAKYTNAKVYSILGLKTQTGDGIRMGSQFAATEGMSAVQTGGPVVALDDGFDVIKYTPACAASREPFLWVGPGGARFTDESCNLNWVYGGNSVMRMQSVTYHVYDEARRKNWVESNGLQYNLSAVVPVGAKLPELDEQFKALEKKGSAFRANTLEELARITGMEPEVLKQTVARYNKACEDKYDLDFGKDPKWLHPVSTPPFYAMKLAPFMLGTLGGLRVDARLRAVDERDKPVPGLYATGRDAGGFYGDSYDYIIEGSTMAFAVFSGKVAAEDAAQYVKSAG